MSGHGSGGLLPLARARDIVMDAVAGPLAAEEVGLDAALGRVLAQDISAAAAVPPFDNSAMDGFAVHAAPAGRELRIAGEARAGRPAEGPLAEGEAIRISTGAPVPEGATAVVPLERVTEAAGTIVLERDVAPGANVRRAGEDLSAGSLVLERGRELGPGELAAAVAAGRGTLHCHRRPRVAAVVTGDELVAPGAPLAPGQIHNSNATMLTALAVTAGAEPASVAQVGDDPQATRDALAEALEAAELVAISGGVSVGPHDHVKPALDALGVRERFWRVAMKPGKPVWFGTRDDVLVLGLPGNPVSAAVCFWLFARPALRALQGAAPEPPRHARLAEPIARSADRAEAVRVTLRTDEAGTLVATPTGPQGSHMLSSLAGADGLALVPAGDAPLPAGTVVPVQIM